MEAAIDVTLLSRYYERFADHAVSVARRVVYLVTGEAPESFGTDLISGPRYTPPAHSRVSDPDS